MFGPIRGEDVRCDKVLKLIKDRDDRISRYPDGLHHWVREAMKKRRERRQDQYYRHNQFAMYGESKYTANDHGRLVKLPNWGGTSHWTRKQHAEHAMANRATAEMLAFLQPYHRFLVNLAAKANDHGESFIYSESYAIGGVIPDARSWSVTMSSAVRWYRDVYRALGSVSVVDRAFITTMRPHVVVPVGMVGRVIPVRAADVNLIDVRVGASDTVVRQPQIRTRDAYLLKTGNGYTLHWGNPGGNAREVIRKALAERIAARMKGAA